MKNLKTYDIWLNESTVNPIVEDLLTRAEPTIQQMVNKSREAYVKKYEREWTKYDETITRLIIISNMVRSFEIYTRPGDRLVNFTVKGSPKGSMVISSQIDRDDVPHYLDTEVIYAGGYNIQALHYRYITKTNLTKTGADTKTKEIGEKIKKLSKLEKINKEIEGYQIRIKDNEESIAKNSVLSDEEIKDILRKEEYGSTIDTTWEDIVRNKGHYSSREEFETSQKQYIADKIVFWKRVNIGWKIENNVALKKNIDKLNKKLETLI